MGLCLWSGRKYIGLRAIVICVLQSVAKIQIWIDSSLGSAQSLRHSVLRRNRLSRPVDRGYESVKVPVGFVSDSWRSRKTHYRTESDDFDAFVQIGRRARL